MRRAVPIAVLFAACNAAPDPATDVGSDSKVEVVTCAPASNLPQRPVAEHCDDDRPVGNLELRREPWQLDPCSGGPGGVVPDQCRTHDDCRGGMNGRCAGNSETGFLCTYDECFTDSDCGPDEACRCEGGVYSDNNSMCVCGRGGRAVSHQQRLRRFWRLQSERGPSLQSRPPRTLRLPNV